MISSIRRLSTCASESITSPYIASSSICESDHGLGKGVLRAEIDARALRRAMRRAQVAVAGPAAAARGRRVALKLAGPHAPGHRAFRAAPAARADDRGTAARQRH